VDERLDVMPRSRIGLVLVAACGSGTPSTPTPSPSAPAPTWPVPVTWRSETIPFPLGFAPELVHRGVEELRFPAGFLDPTSPDYWSYAFVWRLEDDPAIDATTLGRELTVYFRGLIAAVDEDNQITERDAIIARATPVTEPPGFALTAHVFDAFKTKLALDLTGTATHVACPGGGALWTFVLSPNPATLPQLTELAGKASCDQRPPAAAAPVSSAGSGG
jgi:hypothetical protein